MSNLRDDDNEKVPMNKIDKSIDNSAIEAKNAYHEETDKIASRVLAFDDVNDLDISADITVADMSNDLNLSLNLDTPSSFGRRNLNDVSTKSLDPTSTWSPKHLSWKSFDASSNSDRHKRGNSGLFKSFDATSFHQKESNLPHVSGKEILSPKGCMFHLKETKVQVYITYPDSNADYDSTASDIHFNIDVSGTFEGIDSIICDRSSTESKASTPGEDAATGTGTTLPNTMVVLLTNSLGIESDNNLILADRYASKLNCVVVVPDLFDNDPIKSSQVSGPSSQNNNINNVNINENPTSGVWLEKVKLFTSSIFESVYEDIWLKKHSPFELNNFIKIKESIKEIIMTYNIKKMGIISYSIGCGYALQLLNIPKFDNLISGSMSSLEVNLTEQNAIEIKDEDKFISAINFIVMLHPTGILSESYLKIPASTFFNSPESQQYQKSLLFITANETSLSKQEDIEKSIIYMSHKFKAIPERRESIISDDEDDLSENLSDNNTSDITTQSPNSIAAKRTKNLDLFQYVMFKNKEKRLPNGFAVPGDYPKAVVGDLPDTCTKLVTSWIRKRL